MCVSQADQGINNGMAFHITKYYRVDLYELYFVSDILTVKRERLKLVTATSLFLIVDLSTWNNTEVVFR